MNLIHTKQGGLRRISIHLSINKKAPDSSSVVFWMTSETSTSDCSSIQTIEGLICFIPLGIFQQKRSSQDSICENSSTPLRNPTRLNLITRMPSLIALEANQTPGTPSSLTIQPTLLAGISAIFFQADLKGFGGLRMVPLFNFI